MNNLEQFTLADQFWSSLGNLIFYLYDLEKSLGKELVGLSIASIISLGVFFFKILGVHRLGGKLSTGFAQGIISSAWLFPLLLLPYYGTPYWMALFFAVLLWLGAWILMRKIAVPPRRRRHTYKKNR